ncbi:MAG TPA: hypothetical protein VF777_04710 [Phycisphaerales bacterium]
MSSPGFSRAALWAAVAISSCAGASDVPVAEAVKLLRESYTPLNPKSSFRLTWRVFSVSPFSGAASEIDAAIQSPHVMEQSGYFGAVDRYRLITCRADRSGPEELRCSVELTGEGYFVDAPSLRQAMVRVVPTRSIADRKTVDIFVPRDIHCPVLIAQRILTWVEYCGAAARAERISNGRVLVRTDEKEFSAILSATGQIESVAFRMLSGATVSARFEYFLRENVYPAAQPSRSAVVMTPEVGESSGQVFLYDSLDRLIDSDPDLFRWQSVSKQAFDSGRNVVLDVAGQVDQGATKLFYEKSKRPTIASSSSAKPTANREIGLEWFVGAFGVGALLVAAVLARRRGAA